MHSVLVSAPAKINLALSVGSARADGFHPLQTVYQAVDLCDEVRATERDDDRVVLTISSGPSAAVPVDVPVDERNLAVRAALALREHAGLRRGVSLNLRKVIPVAGGMAGGSTDAAAALVACDALWELGTPRSELLELAADLGSDVPFCLVGGTALGTGRGELVSPVLARGTYHWVLGCSDQGLSTPAVYAEHDRLAGGGRRDPRVPADLMSALVSGDAATLGAALHNDLEEAAVSLRPDLAAALTIGEDCGALGGIVSGSGPTLMFLASSPEHALDVATALAASEACDDVLRATGPVPGARITTTT
jgi:4-diphosphocytidyl-2-C-methyl-D-erythritol kinase